MLSVPRRSYNRLNGHERDRDTMRHRLPIPLMFFGDRDLNTDFYHSRDQLGTFIITGEK